MKRFFDLTFRPFFLFTGFGTALISMYAFWPEWAIAKLAKLAFLQDYTIIIQHWGIMVGLMGVFMMGAAIQPTWRTPILTFSAIEKSFMVYLVLSNCQHPYVAGFWIPFCADATIVLYSIAYFTVCGLSGSIPAERVRN